MLESEYTKKRMEALVTRNAEIEQHNRTLSVNLENHAAVVEKLIELNTELMDSANNRAFGHTMNGSDHQRPAEGGKGEAEEVCIDMQGGARAPGVARPPDAIGKAPSFGTALQEFLMDDFVSPRKANASVLSDARATPPRQWNGPGKAGDKGHRRPHELLSFAGGLGGALAKAAAFVSGSDRVQEELPVSTSPNMLREAAVV